MCYSHAYGKPQFRLTERLQTNGTRESCDELAKHLQHGRDTATAPLKARSQGNVRGKIPAR